MMTMHDVNHITRVQHTTVNRINKQPLNYAAITVSPPTSPIEKTQNGLDRHMLRLLYTLTWLGINTPSSELQSCDDEQYWPYIYYYPAANSTRNNQPIF